MVQQQGFCSNTARNDTLMEFYHNKGIDMLKLGCTLPKLANIFFKSQQITSFSHLLKVTMTYMIKYGKT